MKRFAVVACMGCNAVWGIEPAESLLGDAAVADTPGSDPCEPSPGKAKVCVTFKGQPHPAYDITTGAATHRIDGLGTIKVFVFDQDPADPKVLHTIRVQLPLSGGEMKSDDFPITWPSEISPGKHWIIAQFEDNKVLTRTGDNYYVAGDFVTVPTRSAAGKLLFPSFDAAVDQTAKLEITLQPIRRVDVELQADPSLRVTYKDFAVNGDGPITYGIFDGALTTSFLELVTTACAQAQPLSLMPPVIKGGFTTTVTGTHNLLASLEDYDNQSAFPTRGSLVTNDTMPLTLAISSSSWTASLSAKFVKVLNPYKPGEKVDELKCP